MTYKPNYEQRQRVDGAAESFFEQILWKIQEGQVCSMEQVREAVHECDWNECAAIELSLEDELDLVQTFGPNYELDLGEVTLDNLQGRLEQLAVAVIHYLAEEQAAERLREIEDFMDEHGLEFDEIAGVNRLENLPPRSERYPEEGCTVFEYRDVEAPGRSVDVWEVRFHGEDYLYFHVEPDEE